MSKTLNEMVREQILAEGPDIASSRDKWTHKAQYDRACEDYVAGALNAMPNVELLERISNALTPKPVKMFTQEHHVVQGEFGYVYHQSCGCNRCWHTTERNIALQELGVRLGL
jgi:hypothetical protein